MMTQKIRIAHFIETEIPGGAEQLLLSLASDSKKRGHDIYLFHFGLPFFTDKCGELGIKEIIVDSRLFKKTALLPLFSIYFAFLLWKHGIDVLHSHLFGPTTGSSLACWLSRSKHVGTLHDTYMVEEKPSRSHLLALSTWLNSHLVCVSEAMKEYYLSFKNIRSNKVCTIYNSVSIEVRKSVTSRSERSNESVTVMVAGRLIELKRTQDVIVAVSNLVKDFPKLKLVVVGDGPEKGKLMRTAKELAVSEQIHFAGFQNGMAKYYQQADLLVQCSETEGLSLTVLESSAYGLPAIVTNVGANSEVVIEGITGFLYGVGDTSALTDRLRELIEDPIKRKEFGMKAEEHFAETFSYQEMLNSYNGLYFDLVGLTEGAVNG